MSEQELPESFYGAGVNFRVRPEWKRTLGRHGVSVNHVSAAGQAPRYHLQKDEGDIRELFPFEDFEPVDENTISVGRQTLLDFMAYLHHPARFTLRTEIHGEDVSKNAVKNRLSAIGQPAQPVSAKIVHDQYSRTRKTSTSLLETLEERELNLARRLLHFATTGSTFLPPPDISEKESHDCHAVIEAGMRYEEKLLKKPEFADPEEAAGTIPNTEIAKAGFVKLSIDPRVFNQTGAGPDHEALKTRFWELVNAATNHRYPHPWAEISLSGSECRRFMIEMHNAFAGDNSDALHRLVHKAGVEERANDYKSSIRERAEQLKGSPFITRALQYHREENAPDRLQDLMAATSALTPLIRSDQMRLIWARFNRTDARLGPIDDIALQFDAMERVMRDIAQERSVSPHELEAIVQEFYHPMHFALTIYQAIQYGAEKAQNKKGERKKSVAYSDEFFELGKIVPALEKAIQNASLSELGVADRFIEDNHEKIIDSLNRATGNSGNPAVRGGVSIGKSLYEFAGAMLTAANENKAVAAALLAAGLYIAANYREPPKFRDTPSAFTVFNDDGTIDFVPVDPNEIPEKYRQKITIPHIHRFLGGLIQYKVTAQGWVVDASNLLLDAPRIAIHTPMILLEEHMGMDLNPRLKNGFSDGYEAVVTPTADKLLIANYYQNIVPHAMLWAFAVTLGASVGIREGNKHVLRLMHDTADLAALGGTRLIESQIVQLPSRAAYHMLDHLGIEKLAAAHPLMASIPLRHRYSIAERVTLLTKEMLCNPEALAILQGRTQGQNREFSRAESHSYRLPVLSGDSISDDTCEYAQSCQLPEQSALSPHEIAAASAAQIMSSAQGLGNGHTGISAALNPACTERFPAPEKNCLLREVMFTAQIRDEIAASLQHETLMIRNGGLKREFEITAERLSETLECLNRFDVVMGHLVDKIGIEDSGWYQNLILEKTQALRNALISYANRQNFSNRTKLESLMSETLDDVIGGQIYIQGDSPLYRAIFGGDPAESRCHFRKLAFGKKTKFDKQRRSIKEHGCAQFGKESRKYARAGRYEKMKDLEDPLLLTGHFAENAKNTGSKIWGALLASARTSRDLRRKLLPRPVMLSLLAANAGLVGAHMAGLGPETGAMYEIANANGKVLGGAVTTGSFGIFNFLEDSIGIHGLIVVQSIALGALTYHHSYNKLIRPLAITAAEELKRGGIKLNAALGATTGVAGALGGYLVSKDERAALYAGAVATALYTAAAASVKHKKTLKKAWNAVSKPAANYAFKPAQNYVAKPARKYVTQPAGTGLRAFNRRAGQAWARAESRCADAKEKAHRAISNIFKKRTHKFQEFEPV